MPVQNSGIYNQWLHVLMHYTKYFCDQGDIYDEFYRHAYSINSLLKKSGLPQIRYDEYVPVWKGLANGFEALTEAAPDKRRASGAILWRMIKAIHPDMAHNELQNKAKKPAAYRKERLFQKNMMGVLGCLQLDLSAKDKINALDYLEYKYSADEYRRVYHQLGDFNFGENAENFDTERMHTVKLFHKLLRNSRKTTGKDKIISARAFLETIARNAQILDGVCYTDVYGNEKTIDAASKAEMLAAMKKSKVSFSDECLAYFEGRTKPAPNMSCYIGIVLNKFKAAKDASAERRILSQPFAAINLNLQKEQEISGRLVENYAEYLCQYASYYCENTSVRTDVLENLLEKHAAQENEHVKSSSLFAEYVSPKELKSIDKTLVLKTAEIYARSFCYSNAGMEEFNPAFHERMTKMFGRIVTRHPYKKSEVQALCNVLKKNGDKVMPEMSRRIMAAHAQASRKTPFFRKTKDR